LHTGMILRLLNHTKN